MEENLDDLTVDGPWYEATYPDVALSGLSPEQHYRLIGALLGRPAQPEPPQGQLVEVVAAVALSPSSGKPVHAAPVKPSASGLPIVEAPADLAATPKVPRSSGLASREVLAAEGLLAGSLRASETLSALWSRLSLFAQLHGRSVPELSQLDVPPDDLQAIEAEPERTDTPFDVVGHSLREGACKIVDLWYASSNILCLRLDVADGQGEARSVRLYQANGGAGGALVLVGEETLAQEGATFIEAALGNPLLPVLVELLDGCGATDDIAVLAFPSLVRGGRHAAELVSLIDGQPTIGMFWTYTQARLADLFAVKPEGGLSRIQVQLDGAGGGEAIFSRSVAKWLSLFGLVPEPPGGAGEGSWNPLADHRGMERLPTRTRSRTGVGLVLPFDALPTIAVLTEPDLPNPGEGRTIVAAHLIADVASGRPRWSVTLPSKHDDLAGLQFNLGETPLLVGVGGPAVEASASPLPLAVRYRDPAPANPLQLLLPSMPGAGSAPALRTGSSDVGRTLCLLDVSDADAARVAIAALTGLDDTAGLRLALQGEASAVDTLCDGIAGIFSGPVDRLPPGWSRTPENLIEMVDDVGALLLLEDRVLLHDRRTLTLLRSMLAGRRVGSAACVTLHESRRGKSAVVETESGGYFPARVGFLGGPHLLFERPDTTRALPNATYPVVANALSAALIAREALSEVARDLPQRRPLDDLSFGLASWRRGWRHFCTSTVRAGSLKPRRSDDRVDPVALRRMAPTQWADLLGDVTLLRELY